MFTGIIKEIGAVKSVRIEKDHYRLVVSSNELAKNALVGDSIAVNGVCLSVTAVKNVLEFDVVKNTFDTTNLKRLRAGDSVNLEDAAKSGDKLSGHIVTGHVDGERAVKKNMATSKGWGIDIFMNKGDEKYLVSKGSVAIDGVSLTIAEVFGGFFRIFLIPLTLESTTLKSLKQGEYVNIEFDTLAKYANKAKESNITEDLLRKTGFM